MRQPRVASPPESFTEPPPQVQNADRGEGEGLRGDLRLLVASHGFTRLHTASHSRVILKHPPPLMLGSATFQYLRSKGGVLEGGFRALKSLRSKARRGIWHFVPGVVCRPAEKNRRQETKSPTRLLRFCGHGSLHHLSASEPSVRPSWKRATPERARDARTTLRQNALRVAPGIKHVFWTLANEK